ncbi:MULTISPECIES: tyrosine-type recombinase/integrase [Amycolatopsis]|uniref:tyrosine-type recombinase/integrase n=1 Tax=Amycolatopsis TaxID=1813 RepID=UPI000B8B0DA0|nr:MULTISPECIES: site-specific integrase [Amycolatopsis]OXM71993.1 site-specific integrase [Amycolatopsis sp. KNN50.9b]
MARTRPEDRQRGRIEQRGDSLRVVLYAGIDPVTGRRSYLRETIKGSDDTAWRKAENTLTQFRAKVIKQRSTASTVEFGYAIDEWLRTADLETSTRDGYMGYIDRVIKPILGDTPVSKIGARQLETLYAELRRCRKRCDGKPFIELHKKDGEHDCVAAKCVPHECKPMAASTVRQIHSIISGVLNAAVRWEWIESNPAKIAQRPKQKPPEPDPPSPADAARLIEAAFEMSEDWGTLVWLVMTTGMRRAEVAGLRWSRVDLDGEVIEIRRTYVQSKGKGKEKDTKTHQMRRLALDSETVALLRAHKQYCRDELFKVGAELTDDMFVFMSARTADARVPYSPDAISRRYKRMAARLNPPIDTHIHTLRHFSATELLTAGIDLRTVAGRLGHGGGGATTLRVYAAWVAASDRKAAEILGSRMPKRRG